MMLTPLVFSYPQCLKEALELQTFLGSQTTLKERDEILPFFKERQHLSAFLSVYTGRVGRFDRIAHEYPMYGDFTCDLVAGDWSSVFVFVEFENAEANSVFVQKSRSTPEWSSRFEHGFSQILDWFYKMDTQRHSPDFEQRFGSRNIHVSGLLVVGRKQELGAREMDRLSWRNQHVIVHGKQIHSMTFDDLCEDTLERLTRFPALKEAF
jgi:Domain of unknown function (DUF4263)